MSEQVRWCGLPDGGVGAQAWCRGWEEQAREGMLHRRTEEMVDTEGQNR